MLLDLLVKQTEKDARAHHHHGPTPKGRRGLVLCRPTSLSLCSPCQNYFGQTSLKKTKRTAWKLPVIKSFRDREKKIKAMLDPPQRWCKIALDISFLFLRWLELQNNKNIMLLTFRFCSECFHPIRWLWHNKTQKSGATSHIGPKITNSQWSTVVNLHSVTQ